MTPAPAHRPKPRLVLECESMEPELIALPEGLPKSIELRADGAVIWSMSATTLVALKKVRLGLSVVQMTDAEVAAVPES